MPLLWKEAVTPSNVEPWSRAMVMVGLNAIAEASIGVYTGQQGYSWFESNHCFCNIDQSGFTTEIPGEYQEERVIPMKRPLKQQLEKPLRNVESNPNIFVSYKRILMTTVNGAMTP